MVPENVLYRAISHFQGIFPKEHDELIDRLAETFLAVLAEKITSQEIKLVVQAYELQSLLSKMKRTDAHMLMRGLTEDVTV
jgi:hypothetical protein